MGKLKNWIQSIRDRRNAKKVSTTQPTAPAPLVPVTPGVSTEIITPDTKKWDIQSFIPPEKTDTYVLQVSYANEMGILLKVYCMVVFSNASQYKLVAPWLGSGRILEKSNLTELQVNTVEKRFVKDLLK
jgi:hypothetical protein